ncbi:MAG: RNA polymerase sigma factor [Gammaproteobacteria bacterium]|nr:RNA polymerase sigma factor [Gammaproteobacteria bacterium]
MQADDDKVLVDRMLAGDQRAFDDFFNAYFDRLYRFALTRLPGDPDSAEDAVQQTMCRAMEKLKYFRGEAALFTWLCQICRNTIADMFRARGRQAGQTVPFEDSDEVRSALEALASTPLDDPQASMRNEQVRRVVQAILDHLPTRYGDVLEWKYIQGLSVKEIAARLEVAPKAAESTLSRARVAFRQGFCAVGHPDVLDGAIGGADE